ncbi:MAG: cytochrome c4, partial [Gammaproteobacteria bacterium]
GPTGAGNGPAQYPALRGQHAEYTALQLKAYRDGSRATDAASMMRDIAGRLSDADIALLAGYVSALH